jgi:starch-binding outer membrane protein, SusD/RagB family
MRYLQYLFISMVILALASCKIDDLPNPNGSSIEGFSQDASKSELQTLVTGMESLLRQEIGFYYDVTSIIGREYYFFTGSDPRYTGEVLGKGESQLDNNGFYGNRPYFGRYKTVKNGNVLIDAVNNTTLVTAEEANGYIGFAKTFQAYELHIALMLQYQNGIRLEVADPDALGPFVSYDDALVGILDLLEEAKTNLQAAGAEFSFGLSAAMAGFDTPASFLRFNRGLAARIALYQGNKDEVKKFLTDSFLDMAGDLDNGPARFYSLAGGDFANNIFRTPNQADAIIAHPSFIADLTPGDTIRAKKVLLRDVPLSLDDLSGDYDVWVYKSLNDYVPYMRNEELILIAAEANVGGDNAAAVDAINVIRIEHGLAAYSGGTSDAELMDEIMYQRRYSLFGEGHRWVDMRRWGRLDELPLDRVGDNVWPQMPRPFSELP